MYTEEQLQEINLKLDYILELLRFNITHLLEREPLDTKEVKKILENISYNNIKQ